MKKIKETKAKGSCKLVRRSWFEGLLWRPQDFKLEVLCKEHLAYVYRRGEPERKRKKARKERERKAIKAKEDQRKREKAKKARKEREDKAYLVIKNYWQENERKRKE